MGPCDFGPVIVIYPEGVFYKKVTPDDVEEIVNEHFLKGRPVKHLMLQDEEEKTFLTQKKSLLSKTGESCTCQLRLY